ncbi:MAG: type II toxin-antitoxin system RelE/ParE family toxin [Brumimicrobium sp.]|nr:type II toxin-antitoxin system RelE/ParE family toxin [Brumimicrobium sp.]MCO5268516.1 type II toxin-antitoxin system RelE/ParE family toxin [Brumimicrobium sp.]
MNVTFDKSFDKSLDKLKNQQIKSRISKIIEKCETANKLTDIPNLKKMTSFTSYYRIKIGDYRVGIEFDGTTIDFVIVAHRKDIYKVFP